MPEMSEQKKCEQCGTEFLARRWWSRFCGNPCRMKFAVQQRREALHEYRLYRGDGRPTKPVEVAESAPSLEIAGAST